jgi:hypothetical protein
MPDLTPEERQKIYLEEKARVEVRRELEGQRTGAGKIIGYIILGAFGFVVLLWIIGRGIMESDDAKFRALTPEQRHQETLRNCADIVKSFEFKTYSEMSEYERRMNASCIEQLAHPENNVIKP